MAFLDLALPTGRSTAFTGLAAGGAVMLMVRLLTGVSWQWYVLIGASGTWTAGWLVARLTEDRRAA
ncbi:MAG: hypothetical protein O3A25_05590 [Acidobacteria bacterium]|nr:hypothetical protein [Acidobacteriota bacterium]